MKIDIPDEVKNIVYTTPLDSEKMKYYTEAFAWLALQYCFDEYKNLQLSDAPDLQDINNMLGIEVTEVAIPSTKIVDGNWLHYRKTGEEKYKIKAERFGGEFDHISCSYPPITSKDELECIEETLKKKIMKIPSYRNKGFHTIGLIFVLNEMPLPDTAFRWGDVVKKVQSQSSEKFDMLFFLYSNALSYCKCDTYKVEYITLGGQVRDELRGELSRYSRYIAENLK